MERYWHQAHDRYSAIFSSTSPTSDLDEAFKYLQVASAGAFYNGDDVVNLDRLRRKVDRHILPILLACYTMLEWNKRVLRVRATCLSPAMIDYSRHGQYAAESGLPHDLNLTEADLSDDETAFFGAIVGATAVTGATLSSTEPIMHSRLIQRSDISTENTSSEMARGQCPPLRPHL